MKIILASIFWIFLVNQLKAASWKIECEVIDQNKGRSVVTFTSNYKFKDTKEVKFGNQDLYIKLSKAVVAKKSHLSIRNYNKKTKNKIERLWSVGKYISTSGLVSNPFQIKFKTNDNKEGTFKCKGV